MRVHDSERGIVRVRDRVRVHGRLIGREGIEGGRELRWLSESGRTVSTL